MRVIANSSDYHRGSRSWMIDGYIETSDGELVAQWVYYSVDGAAEIWFEDSPDFIDKLNARERDFLEKMISEEAGLMIKEEYEVESAYGGIL